MHEVTKSFNCYVVSYRHEYDGTYEEDYFHSQDEMVAFVKALSVPYTVHVIYDVKIWEFVPILKNKQER